MDETRIDTLTIEIGASSDKAVQEIEKVNSALKGIRNSVRSSEKAQSKITPISPDVQGVIRAANEIDVLTAKLKFLKDAMENAFAVGDAKKAYSLRGQILQVEKALEKAQDPKVSGTEDVESKSGGFLGWLKEVSARTKERFKIKVDAKDAEKASKKVGLLTRTLNALKRIAFYRLIRTAIKEIGEAFREGQENAYWYSKTVGEETKYISEAYDTLASDSFKMKNQLGAAWATLRTAITPVLLEIVSLITQAANAINQFFAVLSGKDYYLKAIDYAKDWADETDKGAKAAKEWKNQLLGFDVINRLEEPSGSGTEIDYSALYEEKEVPEWLKKTADFIKNELGISEFVLKVKDLLFDWGDITEGKLAQKAIDGLGGIALGALGLLIGGVPGAITGTLLGLYLSMEVDDAEFKNGGINTEKIKDSLAGVLGAVGGAAIGFKLAGIGGAIIGALFGVLALGLLTDLKFGKGNLTQGVVLMALKGALTAACAAIGWEIGGVGGAVIGALVGLGISATLDGFGAFEGAVVDDTVKNALNKILPGGLALLGFETGGFKGAIMGLTAGLVLSLVLNKLGDPKAQITKDDVIDTLCKALPGVAGALVFKPIAKAAGVSYGVGGAMLAMTVSTIVTTLISGINADGGKLTWETVLETIRAALPTAGGLLGWSIGVKAAAAGGAIGGVGGALLGLTVGLSLSLAIKGIKSFIEGGSGIDKQFQNEILNSITGNNGFLKVDVPAQIDITPEVALNATKNLPNFGFQTNVFIPGHASGGFPEDGLFFANHTELVGKFSNGRTAVANNDQIVEGISRGVSDANQDVVSAVLAAAAQIVGAVNSKDTEINIDGVTLARKLYRPLQSVGRNVGGSLIEGV